MGKTVKNPKKHIVCCRVNDQEMLALQDLSDNSETSISARLRQSLLQLIDQAQQTHRAA